MLDCDDMTRRREVFAPPPNTLDVKYFSCGVLHIAKYQNPLPFGKTQVVIFRVGNDISATVVSVPFCVRKQIANTQIAFDFFYDAKIAGGRLDVLRYAANVYVTLQYRGDRRRRGGLWFVSFRFIPSVFCAFSRIGTRPIRNRLFCRKYPSCGIPCTFSRTLRGRPFRRYKGD